MFVLLMLALFSHKQTHSWNVANAKICKKKNSASVYDKSGRHILVKNRQIVAKWMFGWTKKVWIDTYSWFYD